MRQKQLGELFVKDRGDIPDEEDFIHHIPCGVAHPGLCAEKHASLFPSILAAVKTLRRILCQKQAASLHTLWALDADGQELASKCFFLSHFRGAGPRLALLTEAELLDDTSMKCRYCSLEGGYADFIDISFIGFFWMD